jgi:endoglucanase
VKSFFCNIQEIESVGLPIFITEYGTVQATGGGAVDYESSMLWWAFNDQYQLSYVNFALFTSMEDGSNCCKHGTNATQIGDPEVWTPSGKLVHKKMMSTDQGVGSCNTRKFVWKTQPYKKI